MFSLTNKLLVLISGIRQNKALRRQYQFVFINLLLIIVLLLCQDIHFLHSLKHCHIHPIEIYQAVIYDL